MKMFKKKNEQLIDQQLIRDFFGLQPAMGRVIQVTTIIGERARKASIPAVNIDYVLEYDGVTRDPNIAEERCKTIIYLKSGREVLCMETYEQVKKAWLKK